jgi:hypothetical protein
MASRARLSQPELRHVPQRAGDDSAERRPNKRLPQAPDVAAHRRENTLRWRERQRAGVLEAAASTLEDGARLARGTRVAGERRGLGLIRGPALALAWRASCGPLAAERLPA